LEGERDALADVIADNRHPLKVFLVAGEHSGDALGARLMRSLRIRTDGAVTFAGVGAEEMAAEGLASLYPMADVAVMGPKAILRSLPLIMKRVYQTVDAIAAANPDVLVIIDSPEFTHPIAKRVRRRAPHIRIIDYVSPSVWAWRPGRAKRMRAYIDRVLGLLPFEPDAHRRLGGPECVYVGHPLSERLDEVMAGDPDDLSRRLNLDADKPVLLVLPGSRRSEVDHLMAAFGATAGQLQALIGPVSVIIPAVSHLKDRIAQHAADWPVAPHFVSGTSEKYLAMRLARAALAASGTVTLELALAGTPAVVAYKVDAVVVPFRFLLKVESVVLANLVLGEKVYPEFLQDQCTASIMAPVLADLMRDGPLRQQQIADLRPTAAKLRIDAESPSLAAAGAVLSLLRR
jgi:lipid-A-disaccharide synthase